MDSRVSELIRKFEQAGWRLQGFEDVKRDWWFDEIILLVSEWRPVGTRLYLTLLTDPMFSNKKVVWAVNLSSSLPEKDNLGMIRQITLNDISKVNLSELVREINSIVLKT